MTQPGVRGGVGWELTGHACRYCMGRVLKRVGPQMDTLLEHRCAECGQSVLGGVAELCWCGVTVKGHGNAFECFRNANITTAAPQEILVRERRMAGR